jgi:hypothetical protein
MATAAQILANRANAQNSTGPRTVEGKTASSLNALKHGADAASVIIPGENPAEYERIVTDYHRDLQPQSALEAYQVKIMIHSDWHRRRLELIETNLYRQLLSEGATPTEIDVTILRDSPTGKLLRRIWSQIASLDRAATRALAEFRRLRHEREQKATEELMQALVPMSPEQEARFQAARAAAHRNEPNSPAKSAPQPPLGNPALRL